MPKGTAAYPIYLQEKLFILSPHFFHQFSRNFSLCQGGISPGGGFFYFFLGPRQLFRWMISGWNR